MLSLYIMQFQWNSLGLGGVETSRVQRKFWKGLLLILDNSQETLMKGRPENRKAWVASGPSTRSLGQVPFSGTRSWHITLGPWQFLTSSPVIASRIKSKQVESGESRGWSHDWLNDQPPKGSNPKLVGFSLLLGGVPSTLVLGSLKFSLKKKNLRQNDDIK